MSAEYSDPTGKVLIAFATIAGAQPQLREMGDQSVAGAASRPLATSLVDELCRHLTRLFE